MEQAHTVKLLWGSVTGLCPTCSQNKARFCVHVKWFACRRGSGNGTNLRLERSAKERNLENDSDCKEQEPRHKLLISRLLLLTDVYTVCPKTASSCAFWQKVYHRVYTSGVGVSKVTLCGSY